MLSMSSMNSMPAENNYLIFAEIETVPREQTDIAYFLR